MQTSVLLSIKPMFAAKIFEGTKRYEFRKIMFKNPCVGSVIVYASTPVRKVIGEFEVLGILALNKKYLWQHTEEHAGVTKEFFDSYFGNREIGYAIRIGKTCLYSTPRELYKDFNIRYAPQSFVYVPSSAIAE